MRQPLREVHLATLLLGYNSTTSISIADSVHAIVRGVMAANRQFAEAMESPLRVAHLEFIELFLDVAISAAGVIPRVAERLEKEADGMGCHLEPSSTLITGKGAKHRLEAISGASYWPRLTITDADRHEDACPPECRKKPSSPVRLEDICPPECLEKPGRYGAAAGPPDAHPPPAAIGTGAQAPLHVPFPSGHGLKPRCISASPAWWKPWWKAASGTVRISRTCPARSFSC